MTQIHCDGEWSCYDAKIRNVRYIKATGEYALHSATIISEISDDNVHLSYDDVDLPDGLNINDTLRLTNKTLIIDVDRTSSYRFTLYCNVTDFCIINCPETDACSQLTSYCFGKCIFDWTTESPTVAPTGFPIDDYTPVLQREFYFDTSNQTLNSSSICSIDKPCDTIDTAVEFISNHVDNVGYSDLTFIFMNTTRTLDYFLWSNTLYLNNNNQNKFNPDENNATSLRIFGDSADTTTILWNTSLGNPLIASLNRNTQIKNKNNYEIYVFICDLSITNGKTSTSTNIPDSANLWYDNDYYGIITFELNNVRFYS